MEIWGGRPTKECVKVEENDCRQEGSVMFIPWGMAVLVRGDTVHAGGMHCDTYKNPYGNPRLHIYIKNKERSVAQEENGNRWHDYNSESESDNDTKEQRAVRTYPTFDEKRKNNSNLGYWEDGGVIRRENTFSKVLFGEMRSWESKTLTMGVRAAKKSGLAGKPQISEKEKEDSKPPAKKVRKIGTGLKTIKEKPN